MLMLCLKINAKIIIFILFLNHPSTKWFLSQCIHHKLYLRSDRDIQLISSGRRHLLDIWSRDVFLNSFPFDGLWCCLQKKQAQMMSKKASLQGLFSWLIFFDFSCHRSGLLVFREMLSDCFWNGQNIHRFKNQYNYRNNVNKSRTWIRALLNSNFYLVHFGQNYVKKL